MYDIYRTDLHNATDDKNFTSVEVSEAIVL